MEVSRRVQRVERELRELLATYLLRELKGETAGFVSVTRTLVSKDLRHAKVFVSVMGEPGDAETTLEALKDNTGAIQLYTGRNLKTKFCPRLTFFIDETQDRVFRINQILSNASTN